MILRLISAPRQTGSKGGAGVACGMSWSFAASVTFKNIHRFESEEQLLPCEIFCRLETAANQAKNDASLPGRLCFSLLWACERERKFTTQKQLNREVWSESMRRKGKPSGSYSVVLKTNVHSLSTCFSISLHQVQATFPPGTLIYKEQRCASCPGCLGATFATTLIS